MHGYSAPQIKAWTPETDGNARYLRSRVPLAPRIAPFEPTQSRRGLDARPRLAVLAGDYVQPGSEVEGYPYGIGVDAYALRFWQYADLFASWHGLPLEGHSHDPDPPYGLINPPNPGYTDAAHRNGVLSLGCWFWREGDDFSAAVEKTAQGTFPVADKLIAMADWFGFDGYFINQEVGVTREQAALLMQMLTYMMRRAPKPFHLQWYDSLTTDGEVDYQNALDDQNAPWVVSGGQRVSSSIFLNYWWNATLLQESHDYAAQSLKLDPFAVVYAGSEIGKDEFAQEYDPVAIFPTKTAPRTSWAFLGSEMVWTTVEGDKSTIARQARAYARERQLWSGPMEDPSRSGRTKQPDRNHPLDPSGWDGTAHNIVEKSPIGALPFVTRFCTGTGERFFIDGQQVGEQPWFNIGIQDLLPTWQWWVRDLAGAPSNAIRVDYDHTQAYDGGSSLRLSGALGPGQSAFVRLYKTALKLTGSTAVDLVRRMPPAPPGTASPTLRVWLAFQDAPEMEWLTVTGTTGTGWSRWSAPLAQWAGRTVAAVSVSLAAGPDGASSIAINLGELRIGETGREPAPATPTGFTVDRATISGNAASVYLSWKFAPDGVAHYDILRRTPAGRQWLGRTYDGAYCVPLLARGTDGATTTLELEAVSVSGRRSPAAATTLRW
ncbi:hypothetical protein [Peterkaempfera sp. SMS 1(5)a]|uniref:endo-beta-N-acetylglucosaminidase n=1 Tax=Peterkaempfera podocarpi TaxID=3232308 RepID=UPI0036710F7D